MVEAIGFTIHTLEVVIAVLYVTAGYLTTKRASGEDAHALRLFSLFWYGIGAYGFAQAAWGLAYVGGVDDLAFAVAVLHMKIAFAVLAFFGLVYYLLFIYTGNRALLRPVAAFYVLTFSLVTYFYAWRAPVGQHMTESGMQIVYANPQGALWTLVVVLMFVPPMIAAVAYASLLRVVEDPRARRRVIVISLAILVFFGGLTFGWLNAHLTWWGIVDRGLALVTVVAVIFVLDTSPVTRTSRGARSGSR